MGAAHICCLDLDCFFVSVERLLNPALCGKPVVVGARPGMRGVVTCASYEVRPLGVRSGIPISDAVRLAPHATYLPTRHGVYSPYAARVREVLERYTPVVQTASIDEFFLDFSGCEQMYAQPGDTSEEATIERVVRDMREAVQRDVGLPASAGIGASRAISKIASGIAKPAGVRMVREGDERGFLGPLPVRKFPGIGPKTEVRLKAAGIETLAQLAALPTGRRYSGFSELASRIRQEMAGEVHSELGRDRPAFLEHDPEEVTLGSISNERTFREDFNDSTSVQRQLLALAERVCWRARKRHVRARTVALKMRYSDFDTLMRSRTIDATNEDQTVYRCILALYHEARVRNLAIRLVGIQLSNLEPDHQPSLPFGAPPRAPVGEAVDAVRERYGFDGVRLGLSTDLS